MLKLLSLICLIRLIYAKFIKTMSAVYIHIPYCKSKCHYCDFYSVTDLSSVPEFLNALMTEIRERAKASMVGGKKVKVDTIYFGGGTPSILYGEDIKDILGCVKENFDVLQRAEITVEVNPDSLDSDFLDGCVSGGVNRISLGVQSHCDNMLKKIGRPHKFSDVEKAIELVESFGITNISVDAILGLPNQNKKSLLDTLEKLIAFKAVKHVSLYALTVEKGTQFFKERKAVDLDFQADLYEAAVEFLKQKNFLRYEISNFSKRGFESKHNSKYWTGENYFGFGAGAHSLIDGVRSENPKDIMGYINNPLIQKTHALTKEEKLEEAVMLALRTTKGISISELKQNQDYDILVEKQAELKQLQKGGLIIIDSDNIRLTDKTFYLLNSIVLKLI